MDRMQSGRQIPASVKLRDLIDYLLMAAFICLAATATLPAAYVEVRLIVSQIAVIATTSAR